MQNHEYFNILPYVVRSKKRREDMTKMHDKSNIKLSHGGSLSYAAAC